MKWKALTAVLGVFVIGLVSGALLGRSYLRSYQYKARSDRGHVRALGSELDLSEKQKEEIGPSLDEARAELYGLRIESYEKAEKIIARLRDKIRPKLNPEQVNKLDKLTQKFHDRRERRKGRLQRKMNSLRRSSPSQ